MKERSCVKRIILILFILIFAGLNSFADDGWSKITRGWSTMPIKVYLLDTGSKTDMIHEGFKDWENKTSGKVRFRFVTKPHSGYANITVSVKDSFNDEKAGITFAQMGVNNIYKSNIEIGLKNLYTKENFTDDMLKIIIRHEIGHALGLPHSADKKSIMYPYALPGQSITQKDLEKLMELY